MARPPTTRTRAQHKKIQIKILGFIWICLVESRLLKGLRQKKLKKSAAFELASQVAEQTISIASPVSLSRAPRDPRSSFLGLRMSIIHVSQFANIKFDNSHELPLLQPKSRVHETMALSRCAAYSSSNWRGILNAAGAPQLIETPWNGERRCRT